MNLNQAYNVLELTGNETLELLANGNLEVLKKKREELCEKYQPYLYQDGTFGSVNEEKLKDVVVAYEIIKKNIEQTNKEKELQKKRERIEAESIERAREAKTLLKYILFVLIIFIIKLSIKFILKYTLYKLQYATFYFKL